jgi:hypothetical protein
MSDQHDRSRNYRIDEIVGLDVGIGARLHGEPWHHRGADTVRNQADSGRTALHLVKDAYANRLSASARSSTARLLLSNAA